MDGSVIMLRKNRGFTLIELLVTVVVGSIAVAILLSILKNAYGLSGQLKLKLDSQTYVSSFIKNFHEDIEAAGYVDFSKTDLNPASSTCASSLCVASNDIQIQTNLLNSGLYRVTEQIEYVVKPISPARSVIHPDELGIYKYININGVFNVAQTDSNALVLAGVKSFTCSPYNANGPKVVDCNLIVYRSLISADTDSFEFYAINEN
jgi:prepilin-type N-terminal cleavage/methylation domain-containing protein